MQKALMCVAFLALCYTCMATPTRRNCTEVTYDNGQTELDCEGGEDVFRDKDGQIIQYQLYQNDSLIVLKFPNRTGCFVVRTDNLPSTDRVQYAEFEKIEEAVEADPDLAADIGEKVEECKTTTVYEMKDVTEEEDADDSGSQLGKVLSRNKRGCQIRYRCYFYNYYYWRYYFGRWRLFRVRRFICIKYRYCYGK